MDSAEKRPAPHDAELRGFTRSLAEIEWLLLILVLVYVVVPGADVASTPRVLAACGLFTLFVLGFRYANLLRLATRWKLTIEAWAMIALTAYVVWYTGKADSPLINLYLLAIIFSALTLGKVITLLEVALIAVLYLHASHATLGTDVFTYDTFSRLMLNFAPFVLVAYMTSLLAADMNTARASAERLSETDDLTQLPNMRAFKAALERHIEQSERLDSGFGVLMIDADGLKQVNDRLGHDAGNELILHVARAIARGLRGSDILARYGGDEFIVLLPGADVDGAREVAERLRSSVAESSADIAGESVSATISIGMAVYPDVGTSARELLTRADRALYVSKQSGRDRAHAYGDPAPPAGVAAESGGRG